jgi:hypothetical protein
VGKDAEIIILDAMGIVSENVINHKMIFQFQFVWRYDSL